MNETPREINPKQGRLDWFGSVARDAIPPLVKALGDHAQGGPINNGQKWWRRAGIERRN